MRQLGLDRVPAPKRLEGPTRLRIAQSSDAIKGPWPGRSGPEHQALLRLVASLVDEAIRLEHAPENAPDFRIEDYARSHPFVYARDELPDLDAYMRRHHPGGQSRTGWPSLSRRTSAGRRGDSS
jgi:hypothetical protein